ncbi:MAG TPA: 16S rRNA (guanine(966)-N(2))-methyltransferase RsmD [Gemmatimonadaceae bacterium]|nr:16S rRNA (guanine(966)-N(2))-methyltransferase RsmD [Gemmatimonadaceae bacterium]
MRIVAGAWRGRQIRAPEGDLVRPTGDRVREAWMSIVNSALPDARVLDLFAGSGALGLESLSRGAREAHFVESAVKSLAAITANVATLGAADRAVIHRANALRFIDALGGDRFDVAFADPPYDKGLATAVAERWLERPFADLLGIEHRADETLPGEGERRKYGGTVITFYRVSS